VLACFCCDLQFTAPASPVCYHQHSSKSGCLRAAYITLVNELLGYGLVMCLLVCDLAQLPAAINSI
jgi:hypothetical protein